MLGGERERRKEGERERGGGGEGERGVGFNFSVVCGSQYKERIA